MSGLAASRLLNSRRPFCTAGPQSRRSCRRMCCAHAKDVHGPANHLAPPLLAMALWTSLTFAAPEMHNLTASADERVSKYDQRVAQQQERKKLLLQAREKALARGGTAASEEEIAAFKMGESPENSQDPQVLAANKKAEEANERRRQEGQRFTLSPDAYSKQSTKGPGLKGVSYTLSEAPAAITNASYESSDPSESPSAPAFDFQEPPTAPQPPKASGPTQESSADPSDDFSAFSAAPVPSAVAPAQPGQQIEDTVGREPDRPFGGLFDSDSTSTKIQAVPEDAAKKAKEAASKVRPPGKAEVQEAAKKVSGKREGPLPLWLAQLLLLAAYGGFGFLAFKKDEETRKAVALVVGVVQKGFQSVQKGVSKAQQLLPSGSK